MKNKKEKSCSLNKFIMFLYNHRGLSVRMALNVNPSSRAVREDGPQCFLKKLRIMHYALRIKLLPL